MAITYYRRKIFVDHQPDVSRSGNENGPWR